MEIVFTILSICYLILVSALFISWTSIKYYKAGQSLQETLLSVIIPVRNEAGNILNLLQDLNAQTYPFSNFEVIIVNDNSTDNTTELVRAYIRKAKYRIVVVDLSFSYSNISSKKKAIETGVGISRGKLMITTDGDCRVGPEWLRTIESFYIDSGCKFIAGSVSFIQRESFFKKLQVIEFASLIASGAASLRMGYPNMCNGANLAYEKQAFVEVNGFIGNENIPSGDDEFLMHKIYKRYPDKVLFLKNEQALVETEAKETLIDFVNQRKRWASKWSYYSFLNIKILAFFVFSYNLCLLASFFLLLFNSFSIPLFLILIIPKIILEFLFLTLALRDMNKKNHISAFLFLILSYPFYIVFIGLLSKLGGYEWKGRKVR